MAYTESYNTKRGDKRYRVFIRRKGHRPLTKVFSKKKEADAWIRENETEAKLKEYDRLALSKNRTLGQLINRYVEAYEGKDHSRLSMLAWWKAKLGEMKVAEVTTDVVADHLDQLRTGKALMPRRKNAPVESERPRSEATVNRYLSALSAVYQAALRGRWGWAADNPCRGTWRGRESAGRVRFLSEDETSPDGKVADGERTRLLKACKASKWPRLHLLVVLALSTGARRGELLGLRWRDVDLARSIAYLADTKNTDQRALPLIPTVREELMAMRKDAAAAAQDDDGVVRDIRNDLVFRSDADPAKPYSIERSWRDALKAAEVENFRFHDLRHSAASYLAMHGATLLEIADVLGHRTLAMVRRYSHLSADHKTKLVNRVMIGLVE